MKKFWQWQLPGKILKFKSGFILFELLVSLAIISIIIGISLNISIIADRSFLKIEIEKLYNIILYLQKKASINKQSESLFIDVEKNLYKFGNTIFYLAKNVEFGFIDGVKGPPSDPKNNITKAITFKNNTIFFYPDGNISAGIIYITDFKKSCLYALSSSAQEISYIRRYLYNQKWLLID